MGLCDIVQKEHDRIASDYDSFYNDSLCQAENIVVSKMLRKRAKFETSVLDLGCGTGLLLSLRPVLHKTYYGIDISKEMLKKAKKKLNRR